LIIHSAFEKTSIDLPCSAVKPLDLGDWIELEMDLEVMEMVKKLGSSPEI
jgi:hypothetical protein